MHHFLCFLIAITLTVIAAQPNEKQTFCRRDRCLTCIGKYCTTTCKGAACDDCPIGDCCNGDNCNICRGSKCCSTLKCNHCVQGCLKACEGKPTCHHDCFQKCIPIGDTPKRISESPNEKLFIISSEKNYLPVNVTTVINITNTMTNENYVHNPVIVNNTNIYNHDYDPNQMDPKLFEPTGTITRTLSKRSHKHSKNCCAVVHPEFCRKDLATNKKMCIITKHKECSAICTAKHIHIVNNGRKDNPCIMVSVKPFFYCKKYVAEDCDACYHCGSADRRECILSPQCSKKCRHSLLSDELYNKHYMREFMVVKSTKIV